jgi:hypothetical protein
MRNKYYSANVYTLGIAFCVGLALYPKHAPAQELLSARGLVCDTAEQVVRVIQADDFYAMLGSVNAEKAYSCDGEKGPKVFIGTDPWQVTQITVVAEGTSRSMVPVEPRLGSLSYSQRLPA